MYKCIRYGSLKGLATALLLMILFFPHLSGYKADEVNYYTVYVNGEEAGHTATEDLSDIIRLSRRMMSETDDYTGIDSFPDITTKGESVLFGYIDSAADLAAIIAGAMEDMPRSSLIPAYILKVGGLSVALANAADTIDVLDGVLERFDEEGLYHAQLISDPERELNVLTTSVVKRSEEEMAAATESDYHKRIGAERIMDDAIMDAFDAALTDEGLESVETGLSSIEYGTEIEVVEVYLPKEEIHDVESALLMLTTEQEQQIIHEVAAGDSLSQIAEDYGVPMNRIIEINPAIESDRDTIRIGDEIILTQPEPELSVLYTRQEYYEEDYDAPVEYVDNDEWYTNQQKVLQQPSAGHRNVVALLSYKDNGVVGQEIEKEELVIEAVPKIVERGTKTPPTFIKPISGGRVSSGFGRRSAPKKGASTNHKGIDWAIPVGTTVAASSGGTVTRAGWGSGYGYVVYIDHGDGRETRYGHLSRVLVSVGQKVRQGERIAMSGNTGRSTGPHIHFEILVNGVAVDPARYMS